MDKNDPRKLYYWLFTEDERAPMGFIPTFFMVVVVSIAIGVLVIPVINSLMK